MFGVWRMKPTSSITPMMHGLVSDAIIRTPEGRQRYLERLGYLVTNVVDVAALSRRIDELSAKIRPVLTNDPSVIEYQQQAAEQLRAGSSRGSPASVNNYPRPTNR